MLLRRHIIHNTGIIVPIKSASSFSSAFKKSGIDGTRVFVSGIPDDVGWMPLKDHFKLFGNVLFASVSEHPDGTPKGVGIVRYETPSEAEAAIRNMRNHPLNGKTLFVREDIQDRNKRAPDRGYANDRPPRTPSSTPSPNTLYSKSKLHQSQPLVDSDMFGSENIDSENILSSNEGWKCHSSVGEKLSDAAIEVIEGMLKERDDHL
jgi:RNA recognition motif-containing protein